MENLTSRKNKKLLYLRTLATDPAVRREAGEFLCEGMTTLDDALAAGAEIGMVLWGGEAQKVLTGDFEQYSCPQEIFQSVSPLKNSKGPVFTVKIPIWDLEQPISKAIVLESVQDPGNVGTVIRTANAFGVDAVLLVGECADLYGPKTVRATMGGIFRQRAFAVSRDELSGLLGKNCLKLFGAALSDSALDVRAAELSHCAVCIGSEGGGLSRELLELCSGQVIIPMKPGCESLNASVAAAVIMWEMTGRE